MSGKGQKTGLEASERAQKRCKPLIKKAWKNVPKRESAKKKVPTKIAGTQGDLFSLLSRLLSLAEDIKIKENTSPRTHGTSHRSRRPSA